MRTRMEYLRISVFFFFQAEDGIRDYKVTGVQTCALPISTGKSAPILRRSIGTRASLLRRKIGADFPVAANERLRVGSMAQWAAAGSDAIEIGRASCRERV